MLLELLYDALRADIGVCVETNDPERLRMKLYAARKEDPQLGVLSFIISPTNPTSDLWIIKARPQTELEEL
jgi:hypothetical protein